MTNTFSVKPGAGALVAAAALALGAPGASALTVHFDSSATTGVDASVSDGGPNDLDGGTTPNDSILALGSVVGPIGGFSIGNVNATATDAGSESVLQTSSLTFSGGNPGETLTVTTTSSGFTAGSNPPAESIVNYSIGGSSLNGTLSGQGTAGTVTTSPLSFDPNTPGTGTGSYSSDMVDRGSIVSPFDMTTTIEVGPTNGNGGNTVVTQELTTAPVPLPAGGVLLLSALGGIAALGRRRKAT